MKSRYPPLLQAHQALQALQALSAPVPSRLRILSPLPLVARRFWTTLGSCAEQKAPAQFLAIPKSISMQCAGRVSKEHKVTKSQSHNRPGLSITAGGGGFSDVFANGISFAPLLRAGADSKRLCRGRVGESGSDSASVGDWGRIKAMRAPAPVAFSAQT